MWLLALAFLQQAAADSYAAVAFDAGCKNDVGCAGFYRAFVATTSPFGSTFGPPSTVTGIAAAAVGVQAASDGVVSAAHVDLAGFKFRTPADTSDNSPSLNFYYGYLGVSGVWNNSTATGSISGAFLEISSSIGSVQVYYDKDSTPGFQWDLKTQNDIYVCTGTWDCIDPQGSVDVKTLTWSPIDLTVVNCTDVVPNAGYSDNCTIQIFTTTGSQIGFGNVLTITARTASQPITINGVLISPLKVKFDVDVTVPWSSWPTLADAANAKVGLIFVHAGKAGGGSAVAAVKNSGTTVVSSLVFNGANGKASYFGYTGTASVDGTTSAVVTERITGDQIKDYKGTGFTALLVVALQAYVGIFGAFGWSLEITVHSWADKHPTTISWDPEVGMTDQTTQSDAAALLPAAGFLLLALFF